MQGAHKPYDYSGDNWALHMEEECFNVQINVHDEEAKQAVIDAAEAARKESEKKAKKQRLAEMVRASAWGFRRRWGSADQPGKGAEDERDERRVSYRL